MIKDKLAIVGMGCAKFGERWNCGIPDLMIEAAYEAFEDAGIGPQDIEMCFFSNTNAPNNCSGTPVADTLKMHGIPIVRNENFCASGHIALIEACMAVASGVCNVAMAIGVEKLKDTGFGGLGTGRGLSTVREARRTAPGSFALGAAQYFEKYGLSYDEGRRMLASIAVKNHSNGMLAPRAHFHKEITIDDCLNAPIIATPLGLYDCCGNSDGAACAIITRTDMAKSFRDDPIYVKGFGISTDSILPHYRPDFSWTSFEALRVSSSKAYEMAGIKNPREEIDLAEVHDCFSITELLIYEDFGFSPRGKAREDIEAGFFTRDGGLPVNVDGGLKCFGHPVGASGIRMTYELYKQLQHKVDNPKRQLNDVHIGLSHTFGGPPQISAVMIVGNEK
ncbi:acetyl-CoA acetyltransferase [uncultured Cohaesibacter sp.]|uniref:acetyl-CoA acetyltransferase n=1 Tax=uncultured Cohaesibacter sp. TaxID=1002546 RepID=UPI00292EDD30|nr:acetyl-CoA acetyltransferase [uncultured Cohaesibacter sp.]